MGLPLSRTRARLACSIRELIFDLGGFHKLVETRERHQLEDSMGFRGQWDDHRNFQIELLKAQGLQPHHRLLELGCGPMTVGIPVIKYLNQNNYVGVDIRTSVLNLAWREVGKAGLSCKNPRLVCSEHFAELELGTATFDFVFSFSVLYHLSDEILDSYFAAAARRLNPAGKCLANVNTCVPSDRWLEFPFLRRPIETYRSMAMKHGLTAEDLGEIGAHGFAGSGIEKHNSLLIFRRSD